MTESVVTNEHMLVSDNRIRTKEDMMKSQIRKRKPNKNSRAMKILKGLSITGLVLIAMTNPYFGLGVIKGFKKYNNKKEWRKFYVSLNYLSRRGYVKILNTDDDKIKVKITHRGEDTVERLDIDSMELSISDSWDGRWRVIIFDVPNLKNKNRLAFTEKLKELGFVMVQKSVWAYPFECYKEIMIIRKFYEIEKYVTYFEAIEIEDETDWRGKFNLGAGAPI